MPLAHILMPQLRKKAVEIEAATSTGYLGARRPGAWHVSSASEAPPTDDSLFRQNISAARDAFPAEARKPFTQGYMKGSLEEHGRQVQEKAQREIDQIRAAGPVGYLQISGPTAAPTASERALKNLRDAPSNSAWQTFKNAALLGAAKEKRAGKIELLPAAPVTVVEPAPQTDRRGRVVIPFQPDEPIGVTEGGQAVDAHGRNLGYLQQPAMVTPYGDVAMRASDRRPRDVSSDPKDLTDALWLQDQYGKHLKAMEDNRDAEGLPTDKFPEGYFKGMSKKERENIIKGVDALRAIERGTLT